MDQVPEIEIPGVRLGDFLGSGANSSVWRARLDSGREVAVKVFQNPRDPGRVFDEASALAQVRHRNIIPIHAVHRGVTFIAIVMDRAAMTLAQLLAEGGYLRGAQVVGLIDDLCAGVSKLHASGVVHGDISPANVGFTSDGVAQLLDFGAVRDPRVLGTAGFSPAADARLRAELENSRDVHRSRNDAEGAEQRMRRLLGGAGPNRFEVEIERERVDLIAITQIGLAALGWFSDDSEQKDVGKPRAEQRVTRKSSLGTVAFAIGRELENFRNRLTGEEPRVPEPGELAQNLARIIPRAPIEINPAPRGTPAAQRWDSAILPRTLTAEWSSRGGSSRAVEAPSRIAARSRGTAGDRGRRPTRARAIFSGAAIIAGIAVLGAGIMLGLDQGLHHGVDPKTTSSRAEQGRELDAETLEEPDENDAATEISYWQRVIDELGTARDSAFSQVDFSASDGVNFPDSPAARADLALASDLAENGLRVAGLRTESRVREVRDVGAQSVKLLVETRAVTQQFAEEPGGTPGQEPRGVKPAEAEAVEIELRLHEGQWLVYRVY